MKKNISLFIASFLSIPAVILICVACAFLSAFIYNQKIETFRANVVNLYSYIESTYEDQMVRIESTVNLPEVKNYVHDPNNPEYRQSAIEGLFNIFTIEDSVLAVALVAPDGTILLSSDNSMLEPDQKQTLIYQKVVETNQPYTTLRFSGDIPLLKIGYPIIVDGNLKAIYIRYTPLNYITYFANNLNVNQESICLLTDDDVGIEYTSDEDSSVVRTINFTNDDLPDEMKQLLSVLHETDGPDSGIVNFDLNHQSVVGYYQVLDSLDWICMISQPRAIILYDLNYFQLITLIVAGFYIVVTNIAVKRFFGRYIHILDEYNDSAEEFVKGNLSVRFHQYGAAAPLTNLADKINLVFNRVDQLERSNAFLTNQLNDLLTIDPITKLLNNRALYQEIDTKFGDSPNQLLIMFNTGIYDQLNQTFGNSIANRLLEIISDIVRDFMTDKSHAARLATDNFCIFIEDFDDINHIHKKLNELRVRLGAISRIDDLEIEIFPNIAAVFRDEHLLGRSDWLRLVTEVLNESSTEKGSFTIFDFTNVHEINRGNPTTMDNILLQNDYILEGFSRSTGNSEKEETEEQENNEN